MENLEKTARQQLLFTKIICGALCVLAAAMIYFVAVALPEVKSVLKKTDMALENTNAILERIDLEAVEGLSDTVKTLDQAVEPIRDAIGLLGVVEDEEEKDGKEKSEK